MTATILIVEDEENARKNLETFLIKRGYEALCAANLNTARKFIAQESADIILLDVQLPDGYGPDLLAEIALLPIRLPVILITAFGDIDMAVEAMKNGAHDFLQKPIDLNRLEKSIERAKEIVALRREVNHFRIEQRQNVNFVIGENFYMSKLVDQAKRAAKASVSVLITGETGTGKEVLARFIHQMGPRSIKPFIPVNCAAIQSTMLESELFGHEAGAFTGALKRKNGLMEVADDGILFLDEISSMPLEMQAKLLRALDEHNFFRVGGTNTIKVDVQILAASNRDLGELLKTGKFREDLYYRLKVVDLEIPPLRERKDLIPELIGSFIRENNSKMGVNINNISQRALDSLCSYSWPGNIRQLKNEIERAMLFCDEDTIDLHHLSNEFYS
jgi:two-component system response regulator AtoC